MIQVVVYCVCVCVRSWAHIVNVIDNGKRYKMQRIEDKPTSALEQTRLETGREEINTGLLDMSHTWTENTVRLKKGKICVHNCH